MDFEWEKLINGESDIDADDINALADGIIENEKEIKAIKDIMDNGGTIPEYLTGFFKPIPEGKTIDDLNGEDNTGCYILYEPNYMGYTGLLYVVWGTYFDGEMSNLCTWQTRYVQDGHGTVKIETRNDADGYWTDWEDVFATPQYVNEQIAKIPTGGGGEWTLLIDYITSEQIFTPEISNIVFTEDDNGNPLSCSAIYVEINGKLFRENSNDLSYRLYLNTYNNLIQCTKIKNGEYAVTGVYVGKRGNGRATVYTHSTGVTFYAPYTIEYQDESITSVKITGNNYNETHLDAGASIRIYGMR